MKPITLEATTLPDAWFQVIDAILNFGRVWEITQGSYVGQKRWELDYITVHIKSPGARPLIPEIPPGLNIPAPVSQEYIDQYLPYLLTTNKEPGEDYTYGERLVLQMEKIIERYKKNGGGSNQECISISKPEDIDLPERNIIISAEYTRGEITAVDEKDFVILVDDCVAIRLQ